MGLFSKTVSCIGLDIGEHRMKLVEAQKAGTGYEITGYGVVPTPPGLMEGSMIIDEQGIIATLGKLVGKVQLNTPRVALAVSGENVIVRNLSVPAMPDRELAEAIRIEAEAQLPIPGKDVTIDFIKCGLTSDGTVKKQEILAVAVRNDIIKRMTRIAAAVGLEPVIIDVEPLVLQRALKILNPGIVPVDGSYAIVNIGKGSSSIAVFENDRLSFTRTLGFGGDKLSMALVNHYNMPLEEAEGTKKLIDFSGDSDQHGLTVLLYQKAEILLPVIGELVKELGRSLDYYLAQHRGQRFSKIFITGGSAQLKGLDTYMANELDLPVAVFNPTRHMQLSGKVQYLEKEIQEAGTALTQVAGLALSEVE